MSLNSGATNAGFGPSDQVNLYFNFGATASTLLAVKDGYGFTAANGGATGSYVGTSPVPANSDMRVVGAAVEFLYNGPVLDMGTRISYIPWGTNAASYSSAIISANGTPLDLSTEQYAHTVRLDRHMVVPWTGGMMAWQVAEQAGWSDGTTGRGYKQGVANNAATYLSVTGDNPPIAGIIITMPASVILSGNLQVRITRHVEYFHDTHGALSGVAQPAPAASHLIQAASSYACRRDIVRHGNLQEYVASATSLIKSFVSTYLPGVVPKLDAAAAKVGRAAGAAAKYAGAATAAMSAVAAGL